MVIVSLDSTLLGEDVDVDFVWEGVLLIHLDLRLRSILDALPLQLLCLVRLLLDLLQLVGLLRGLVGANNGSANTEAAKHQDHDHNDDCNHTGSSRCNSDGSLVRDRDSVVSLLRVK